MRTAQLAPGGLLPFALCACLVGAALYSRGGGDDDADEASSSRAQKSTLVQASERPAANMPPCTVDPDRYPLWGWPQTETSELCLLGAGDLSSRSREVGDDALCELPWLDRTTTPSTVCLSCHDGTVAVSRSTADGRAGNHPIAVDYQAALIGEHAPLRPVSLLPVELVLVGGRVECTTCHDGQAELPSRTALPLSRSALCFGCHDI